MKRWPKAWCPRCTPLDARGLPPDVVLFIQSEKRKQHRHHVFQMIAPFIPFTVGVVGALLKPEIAGALLFMGSLCFLDWVPDFIRALRRLLCRLLGHRWREIWHGIPPRHELRRECRRCRMLERRTAITWVHDGVPVPTWERVP